MFHIYDIYNIIQVENRIERQVETCSPITSLFVSTDGVIILAAADKGHIQSFDIALQPIFLVSRMDEDLNWSQVLDLGKYFKSSIRVRGGVWPVEQKNMVSESKELSLGLNHLFIKLKVTTISHHSFKL